MIPSIPLALLAGLLAGLLFAWAARGPFRAGRAPWGDEVRAVGSYVLFIRWPLLLYFFFGWREWSFLYLVRAEHLPTALLILLLPLDALAVTGGYLGGWSLLRRRARGTLALVIGGVSLALVLFVIALRERLFFEGDTASFDHTAHAAAGARLLAILVVTLVGSTVAAVFVYRTLAATSGRRKPGSAGAA